MPVRPFVSVTAKLAVFFYLLTSAVLFAQKPLGVDVSNHQTTVNWTSIKNSGVSFAWCKATEGTTFTDAYFASNESGAKAAGVLIGAYHFARPGNNTPTNEAAFFWSVAQNYIANGGPYMMPVLDYEDFTGHLGATSTADWANQWCNIVSNYARLKGVTIKPIIYVSACNSANFDSTVSKWTPWIANYNGQSAQTGTPWSVCASGNWWGSGNWTFWQYSSSGSVPGVSGNCDVDVFNGTAATLQNYVIGGSSIITSQPSSRFADRGSSLTMRVGLTSTTGATYQWRFNGTAINGGTKSTLTLTNIQSTNAGSYSVVIGGTPGTATSSNAVLTVFQPYTPVFSDDFDTNSLVNWFVNSSSSDTRATFAYDYSAIGVPSAPNSSGTTKGLRMEANLNAAAVAAVSVSPKNQSFGSNYRLHFDMWINVIGPFLGPSTGGGTGSTEALTAGVGTAGNRVEWNGAGSTADGVYFFVDGDGDVGDTSTTFGDYAAYIGTTFQGTGSGVYAAGTQGTANQTSDSYYQNVFPGGQGAPAAQLASYSQQTGTLATGTVGMGWHDVIVEKSGSSVSWYIDGLKIATVSGASITQSNVSVGYWDPFSGVSGSTNLSFGLVDNLRVEVPAVAPTIVVQPASQSVVATSNATFSVSAIGTPAPNYQWRLNGTAIPNATVRTYTVSNARVSDVGSYSVIVSNVAGFVTSSSAVLTVVTPPTATSNPAPLTVNVGGNASLAFTATGSQPLSFYWTHDGVLMDGQTADHLDLTNVQLGDAGNYVGYVYNAAGTNSTSPALLTVVQMQAQAATMASDGSFQFTINGAPNPNYLVEGSSNLVDWITLAVLTNDTGTVQFTDTTSTNSPQYFYRVSVPK
jgi:GH25 family lysozyme M1 (1,4-beta-N-acetylmuramidase)